MALASSVFSAVFLSPLLFVLLIGVAVWLIARARRRAAMVVLSVTAAVVLLLSTGFVRSLLLAPLERHYPPFPQDAPHVDAVVVLGGGIRKEAPDEGGNAALNDETRGRVLAAFLLSRRLDVPLIVSGGVTSGQSQAEADVAARLLGQLGMPAAQVILESRSTTTWENAREVALILASRHATRIALVTSAFHMPRAMLAFSRNGVSCVPVPVDHRAGRLRLDGGAIVPGFGQLGDNLTALREYVGLVLYWMRR